MRSFPDAETVSAEILAAANHRAPPTDLKAVCSLWPQLNVVEEALEKSGYLLPLGVHGAEVLLRKSDPIVRKQFTLAHELGHWVLANLEAGRVRYGSVPALDLPFLTDHKRNTPEETWCNRFASCLLMPASDIHKYLGDIVIENVSAKISVGHMVFQVSQEAFLTRVSQITRISIFEVVSFDSRIRVQRKFLCAHHFGEAADLLIREVSGKFPSADFPPDQALIAEDYQVVATLTRDSLNLKSWLVAVTPKAVAFLESC